MVRPGRTGSAVNPDGWFLTAAERGNEATTVDVRAAGRTAWTTGNRVRPLVHGAAYFAELLDAIRALHPGDHLFFTDWRGDPDERSAARLQAWHDGGRQRPRPPGRLRPYSLPRLSPVTRWWSAAAYRHLYDPDGRPAGLRRAAGF